MIKIYRINIGGAYSTILMHKLLQLKYPQHAPMITISRAQVCSIITITLPL